jgi:hypothetical protein
VGNSTAIDSGHTNDRRIACPPYTTLGLSAHSCVGLQHGLAVDGGGLDAKVKHYNCVQIYSCCSDISVVSDSEVPYRITMNFL